MLLILQETVGSLPKGCICLDLSEGMGGGKEGRKDKRKKDREGWRGGEGKLDIE